MRLITLALVIFSALLVWSSIIYAIVHSKIFTIIVLILGAIIITAGLYAMWLDIYPSKPKKDKIIKDYPNG